MDGEVFATSYGNDPLEFELGQGAMLPGVEEAVEGMATGEKKEVKLPPEVGFGHHQDELILMVERSQFPEDFTPEVGMEFQVPQPDGSVAFFKVLEVHESEVKLDANHPLAGETLIFELELLDTKDKE